MKFEGKIFRELQYVKVGPKFALFLNALILNGYCAGTVYSIRLPFDTSIECEYVNLYAKANLDTCHTFSIRGAQSWKKSRNFTIFAFFAIFDKL